MGNKYNWYRYGTTVVVLKGRQYSVPAVGVLDSGSDLTIIGAEWFTKVALTARLHKRDFKKADKIPITYDKRTFSLDGRLDLDIEFAGKSMHTPE